MPSIGLGVHSPHRDEEFGRLTLKVEPDVLMRFIASERGDALDEIEDGFRRPPIWTCNGFAAVRCRGISSREGMSRMPGRHVNDHQMRLYMKLRQSATTSKRDRNCARQRTPSSDLHRIIEAQIRRYGYTEDRGVAGSPRRRGLARPNGFGSRGTLSPLTIQN